MTEPVTIPRLMVAGIGSDSGKTTVTLGLIAALQQRGRTVQAFKAGSDLMDSTFLAHATRRTCRTLDSWVLGGDGVLSSFAQGIRDADAAIIEGAGGLFDGHGVVTGPQEGSSRFPGSSAEIARITGSPIVLVLDIGVMAETAAAVALGVRRMDPEMNIAGVILNNVGNAHRRAAVEDAVWELARLPVLGAIPHTDVLHVPDAHRHMQHAADRTKVDAALSALGDLFEKNCNLDLVERIMATAAPVTATVRHATAGRATARIGVAFDEAFCFYYPENIEMLQEAGAEIVPLSPLDDHLLPRDLDAVYLGGGIIESFIPRLAANRPFIDSLRRMHQHGVPIYAECGGALYVARSVEIADGTTHPMAGLADVDLSVSGKRHRNRYREVEMTSETLLGPAGTHLRGHEFHGTERLDGRGNGDDHAYSLHDSDGEPLGREGWTEGSLLASMVHLHFGQDPEIARRFVDAAREASSRRHVQPV